MEFFYQFHYQLVLRYYFHCRSNFSISKRNFSLNLRFHCFWRFLGFQQIDFLIVNIMISILLIFFCLASS
ncbi:hypothetical protein [Tundra vole stool-associated circular virus]|nr:hypothetical protein [Tundra vole stool-associated circular virus]